MKERARVVRVFVASPRDTAEEKGIIREVVADLNRQPGRDQGFTLDLLISEEDAYPSVGADAQDVINRQIGEYDILIGLMSTRFGSPTGRANSGTEEEFNRALERHLQGGTPRILFYFRDPQVRFTSIDPYQALQIRRFRERIQRLGVYYEPYETGEQFRRRLASGLLQTVHESGRKRGTASAPRRPAGRAGNTQTERLPDWHASTQRLYPQWASYRDIPLERYSYSGFSLTGTFRSPSPYFRFGVKLLTPEGRLFGDGAVQSHQDNNLLVHLGKNEEQPLLFLTSYYNGVRQALDRPLVPYESSQEVTVSVNVAANERLRLSLDSEEVYRAHVSPALTKRLVLVAWGDEHEYAADFRNIDLQLNLR